MRSGLLPEARHLVLPAGIVSTGYPATEATCRRIGIVFDRWQADLNRCILAKDAEGLYAADTVALSISRQVGKTFDVGGVVFADSIITPGTTTVWTAHRFKVARESFNELRAWARSPLLRQHVDYDDITTGAGNECIPFRNGSRIVFAARERGAIRGFTKVRRLVIDEGQILTEFALSDLAPTMNQAVNPQIIFMGTPPKPTDPSEVWTRLRSEALAGDSEGVLYVEISAAPESDLDDRDAWREANPSYPHRTPEKAMLRLRKLLSAEDFRREALGIWDSEGGAGLSLTAWVALADPESAAEPAAFAVEVSRDRATASIGMAGVMAGGRIHLELVDRDRGVEWLPGRCVELDDRHGPAVFAVDTGGPAASLIDDLERAGVKVLRANASDVAAAAAGLVDAVAQGAVSHGPQPELDQAVGGAKTRPLGDGAFTFGRKVSTADVTPLIAVMLARWAAVLMGPIDIANEFG
jgi:hypothetical protein